MTPEDANARALALVQAYCGWHIAPEEAEDVTMDGPGRSVLILPTLRLVDVSSITEDGNVVDPTGYAWSRSGMIRRIASGTWGWWRDGLYGPTWTPNLRGLQLAYTHGYETMPLEVQGIIDAVAARNVETTSQVLVQVGQVQYATGVDGLPVSGTSLSSSERDVLDAYKLPRLP